ncbi:unnamed protein product, partial [Protopolystoma xenopodis]
MSVPPDRPAELRSCTCGPVWQDPGDISASGTEAPARQTSVPLGLWTQAFPASWSGTAGNTPLVHTSAGVSVCDSQCGQAGPGCLWTGV